MTSRSLENRAAPTVNYFTPYQNVPAGLAADPQSDGKLVPKLFQKIHIRGVTFSNRIGLSPLCQYSTDDGHMTDWRLAHLGAIAQRGAGFLIVEATAVSPEGRITPQDHGLWKDSQIEPLRRVVDFIHSQNQVVGIQLAHAGRKASMVAPWISFGDVANEKLGGWPKAVQGPGDIPYAEYSAQPQAMCLEDIGKFKADWVAAVKRAVKAGVDFIEIHNAHGYLLMSCLSPATNKRSDGYGGTFENRIRLTLEIAKLTRASVPDSMPVIIRLPATDWLEESLPHEPSWRLEDAVAFSQVLADTGYIDAIDVCSGGNHSAQKLHVKLHVKPSFQALLAANIKQAVGDRLFFAASGMITTAALVQELVTEQQLDFVLVGRGFLKNPALVWKWAEELQIEIGMANRFRWPFAQRGRIAILAKALE
ncbi:putative NADH-dependent flavin oxidoreductase [Aspergillus caelatus]|uniref:Putative NADH-dependent flavin oxidoreductase n=1 Tax=Aspergillus caelatus TaxID=61420 RepID=A0A5N6ZQV5_9EURO|nr:putative NADH-dependent flavin oxidoreductase [Aspergillus caelatus]KAE8359944.1 putative NADH-dependent flavin oxidoreductase [Aspergillus caelatus]